MHFPQLQTLLSQQLKTTVKEIQTVGGGCINQTYKVKTIDGLLFCKVNSASKIPQLFEKEKRGLELIQNKKLIKTPAVIDCFTQNDEQVLVLEWIEEGSKTNQFWKTFGEELALLHQVNDPYFGLKEDNFMGSVPQSNVEQKDWASFFISERLQPLVKRCNHLLTTAHVAQFEIMYWRIPQIFSEEPPALLHGDLWSGNFMCNNQNEPVLIDPAVYFGHRSADLAMTTLFGGFHPLFYESYHYHFPFPSNYKEQWDVCNLYPLLIHLFLFGKSYVSQIEQIIKRFK